MWQTPFCLLISHETYHHAGGEYEQIYAERTRRHWQVPFLAAYLAAGSTKFG
jgi:hypothetical protein